MVYVAKIDQGVVKLYDAGSGRFQRIVSGDPNPVSAVAQGDVVSVTYKSGLVKTYDAKTGRGGKIVG